MIYFLQRRSDSAIKIGFSDNPKQRLSGQRPIHKPGVRVLGLMEGSRTVELELHRRFAADRVHEPGTREWFRPTDELVTFIREKTCLPGDLQQSLKASDRLMHRLRTRRWKPSERPPLPAWFRHGAEVFAVDERALS